MSIQHRDIQDGYIHEPKGIVSANSGMVYVATGDGSGVWRRIDSTSLSGLNGDSAVANKPVVSNGSNGFKFGPSPTLAQIGSSSTAMTVTVPKAAASPYDNTAYGLITGQWSAYYLNNVSFSTNSLAVYYSGIYLLTFEANLPYYYGTATATFGFKYRVNGGTYQERPAVYGIITPTDANGTTIAPHIHQTAMIQLAAGDYVQWMACSSTGQGFGVTDCNITLTTVQAY
jgi:hypothetical protein